MYVSFLFFTCRVVENFFCYAIRSSSHCMHQIPKIKRTMESRPRILTGKLFSKKILSQKKSCFATKNKWRIFGQNKMIHASWSSCNKSMLSSNSRYEIEDKYYHELIIRDADMVGRGKGLIQQLGI